MDSTKVIADLCAVIDRMNVIIQAQAMELASSGRWPTRRRSRPCGGSTPGPSVRGWDLEPGGNSAGRRRGATGSHDADPGGTDQGKSMVRHRQGYRPRHQWGGDRQGGPTGAGSGGHESGPGGAGRDQLPAPGSSTSGDETIHGVRHTKEHFDQILRDITNYEQYCKDHPRFENNTTVLTSQRIKDIYEDCLAKADFL